MQNKNNWKIWIDTGGTFTDCIGIDSHGVKSRLKILSSGSIRGRIIRKINPFVYEFEASWNFNSKLLEHYTFTVADSNLQSKLLHINYLQGTLTLEDNLTSIINQDFELSTGEEAPILAARLITNTPLNEDLPYIDMRLGTTKGTNALLEKKGAPTTLIISQGFSDLLYINTQQRPQLFQNNIPEPFLLHENTLEADGRISANGKEIRSLSKGFLKSLSEVKNTQSVAISLLHSPINPSEELQVVKVLEKAGVKNISVSSTLAPYSHYLRRTQTTVTNAYLQPILKQYISHIKEKLGYGTLKIMASTGGLTVSDIFEAKDSLLSGPAGGVIAAASLAKTFGYEKVLTFDMGGTSTDATRIDKTPVLKYTTRIADFQLHHPSLDVETVAAGGGSICWFDGHTLRVGPESAGADPGPACYGAGGPLTLTDVNLLLGKLDPSRMSIPVRQKAAVEALKNLINEIFELTGNSLSPYETLIGLQQIANEKMAGAISKISLSKGHDPAEYSLIAYGGAGGLHACQMADILGVKNAIIPFDAGLFSASGIGIAKISSIASIQVLKPFEEVKKKIPGMIKQLISQAVLDLKQKGVQKFKESFIILRMRLAGQENCLEINYSAEDPQMEFQQNYSQQFGYFPLQATIEVESIRIMLEEVKTDTDNQPVITEGSPALALKKIHPLYSQENSTENTYVYDWNTLSAGETINGPAVILNETSSSYLPANWFGVVQHTQDIIVSRQSSSDASQPLTNKSQEVNLQLFMNRFSSIANAMGLQLQHTAFSVNIKERLDFSCAVLDSQANLLANAQHIPVHLGSMGICARLMLEKIKVGPGDVIITNHPGYGGSHLPDITLLAGAFTDDGKLIGYVINRAHHSEIGGKSPGSMPPDAVNLEEEGVVILPQYLYINNELQSESLKTLFTGGPYPTREYAANEADILAAYSALQTGISQLKEMAVKYGLPTLKTYMSLIKENTTLQLKAALVPFSNQVLKAAEFLDDGSKIAVTITISDDKQIFDFTGTSRRHPNNLNATIAIVYSTVLYVLRLLIDKEIPLNDGLMENVEIILPPDTLLHPVFSDDPRSCPAVVGGNTEVSQRLTDTLLKAFGQVACSQGTMNNFLFGDNFFGYYETIGGGTGAGPDFHGRSAVHQHMTNTQITDPEDLERKYPVRLLEFGIRKNSGGQGKFNGGNGIIRRFEFLKPLEITLIGQHHFFAPYGINGGRPGKTAENTLIPYKGNIKKLPGVYQFRANTKDQLLIETPGGGGYGESEIMV